MLDEVTTIHPVNGDHRLPQVQVNFESGYKVKMFLSTTGKLEVTEFHSDYDDEHPNQRIGIAVCMVVFDPRRGSLPEGVNICP